MNNDPAATQLRNELNATIRRFAQESDVTVCEAIGVLWMVMNGLLTKIEEGTEQEEEA